MNEKPMINEYSMEYFIHMISSFVNGEKPCAKQEIVWEDLIYLSRIHSLTGLLGYMSQLETSEFGPDEETKQKLFKAYLYSIQSSVYRDAEAAKIIKCLCDNEIPHILMKGYVVQRYYPLKELRSMGDIDIAIHKEDVERADRLVLGLGYEYDKTVDTVREYYNKYISFELHSNIHSSTYKEKNSRLIDYFRDCWSHAEKCENGYSYELKKEYHLLFLLSHMAKHFLSNGCGIRMVLDIAVYIKHFGDSLDYGYLNIELERLGLARFAGVILSLCKLWFDIECPLDVHILDDDTLKSLTSFIIEGGVFGAEYTNKFAKNVRMEYEKNTGKSRFLLRLKAIVKSVFPDADIISKYYPKAGKGIMYSIAGWFVRSYSILFKRKGYSKKLISDIRNADLEAYMKYKLLRDIGL